METKLKQERLLRIIEDELQDLPPLPAVIVRVMQTINDPNTSAADLNRLISADQALASKVLRLVNSSYYGFPRKISTITNAVVILGFNTVRNLTTSLGVFNAFDAQGQKTALDRDEFWAHSLGVAVAAGVIARRKGIGSKSVEEVFIGGLMHDIGKLFLDQYFPDQYAIAIKLAGAAQHLHLGGRKDRAGRRPCPGRQADRGKVEPAAVADLHDHPASSAGLRQRILRDHRHHPGRRPCRPQSWAWAMRRRRYCHAARPGSGEMAGISPRRLGSH